MALGVQILCFSILGIIGFSILITLFKTGKFIRSLIGSGIQGICALAAVNIIGTFTGLSLGMNLMTTIGAVILGVPGIITMIALKTVFAI